MSTTKFPYWQKDHITLRMPSNSGGQLLRRRLSLIALVPYEMDFGLLLPDPQRLFDLFGDPYSGDGPGAPKPSSETQ